MVAMQLALSGLSLAGLVQKPLSDSPPGHSASAAKQFTAVDMLTAPRPQPAILSPDGVHAVSVVDQWDEHNDITTRTVYILEPTKAKARPRKVFSAPTSEAREFVWLSPDVAAYINGSAFVHFTIGNHVADPGPAFKAMHIFDFPKGSEPSALQFEPVTGTLTFSAAVWGKDGEVAETPAKDKEYEKRGDSALIFDDLFVRHWDTWRTPGRVYTLAATHLKRPKKGCFVQRKRAFHNLLKGTGLVDGVSQYALSPKLLAIALKPPHLNPATHTRTEVYLLPLKHKGKGKPKPKVLTPGDQGAVASLVFSPNHEKLAWLQMAKDGYESDRNVLVVHTLNGDKPGESVRWTDNWDRSPQSVVFGRASKTVFMLAENKGRVLPYHLSRPDRLPTPLSFKGSTSSFQPISIDKHLLSVSSLTSPTDMWLLDLVDEPHTPGGDPDKQPPEDWRQITHYSEKHINGRLDTHQPREFWFEGEDGRRVMAWVLKPHGHQAGDKKKWPMAFMIHGGPQGAWGDSWSTRWNPAVYAAAGYFVVAVNPTGSTGYGQDFTDRIQSHWGDRPYQDLLLGYRAVLDKFPEIDPERTAALGASYGGYMINWINGHNAFGFKALVYHDGMLDTTYSFFATEEVYFPTHDFGGSVLAERATYEKWNPLNHVQNWKTPQLVIQGGKDYRLDESQAIGTFTALQLQGVPSRFVYFPDENHWVLKPSNSRRWHHEVLEWLDEWVGEKKKKTAE